LCEINSLFVVLRCCGRIVTIFALCCAIELHWVALQSLAWTSMLVENSKRATLRQAIAQTFDGAHPCSLCHAVQKGKNSEKRSDVLAASPKVDMICLVRAIVLRPSFVPFAFGEKQFLFSESAHSPPVPPPRSFPG
jgi:hypothetical protein